jgi:hypothetical protein
MQKLAFLLVIIATSLSSLPASAAPKTRTVVLIVSDGLRWQEVFTGADPLLLDAKNGGSWMDEPELRKKFWRDTPEERRRIVFPFLWGTVATHGQIFGNQLKGSVAHVTNGMAFSYPGYNEMTVGYPDPRIDKNEFGPNPNVTVFEWLNRLPEYSGHVAVFGTWSVFDDIFNKSRSHLVMQTGWSAPRASGDPSKDALLARLFNTTTRFDEEDVFDSFVQVPVLDYVRTGAPRVLFVGYGETDNWGHQGRYDLVLDSAQRMDGFVAELWKTMQAMPEYRDRTTFIITCDHGRGSGPSEWKEHGVEEKGSENVWIAVIGPDTAPLGERSQIAPVTQSQIAASVAALLGRDYHGAVPATAPPIADVLGQR